MLVRHLAALTFVAASAAAAHADEGMWTYNRFPTDLLRTTHGFAPDQAWLDHVRLSSARLAQGCSASFVSPDGLVMTNHHCVHGCVEELSSAKKDLIADGFYAKAQADELMCPNLEVNQLVAITDVTARVMKAAEGLSDAAANEAKKAEKSKIEKECATSDALLCEVVTLYNGGVYDLYTYARHQDVRLAFAPELGIAFFGGDPDNFMFPRHALDVAFVRVYEGGKPAKVEHYFKWSPGGTKDGELTFVSGNPGRTSRLKTFSQVQRFRDRTLIASLVRNSELRGQLVQYAKRGKEQARHSKSLLFGYENWIKAMKGEADALFAPGFMERLKAKEEALRAKVMADKAMAAKYGGAWQAIADALEVARPLQTRAEIIEGGRGFQSDLFTYAKTLVRAQAELAKDNGKRLREYADAALPGVQQRLFAASPVYPELEIFRLTFSLTKMREDLGPDDELVKLVLGKESPEQLATRLVKGTKLADPKLRRKHFEARTLPAGDAMVALVQLIDPQARALRKKLEDEVEAVVTKQQELIAAARFALEGTNTYPDATFSPRLSFGEVRGWSEDGKTITPYTTFATTFERHSGADPFALPKSWLDANAKGLVDLTTPMNLSTDNDIIGGNSGSPVFNKDAEIVGLVFDGNIHSLGGDYGFDDALNRTVAVDSRAILHALDKVYRAERLAAELRGGK